MPAASPFFPLSIALLIAFQPAAGSTTPATARYTAWRNNVGGFELTNETVSIGSVDEEDYQEWKSHFDPGAAPHQNDDR